MTIESGEEYYYERKRREIEALPDDPKPVPMMTWEEYYTSRMEMIERGELLFEEPKKPIEASEDVTAPANEPSPKRKRGRPSFDDKPLSDFLADGVDEEEFKKRFRKAISQINGKTAALAEIEERLICDGVMKKGRISYKVLKREFEDLIKCTEPDYNRHMSKKGL